MPENLQNHYLRPQIKKRYSALVMLILIIMLCAALRPEIYNCIIYRGSIYNADRGELTTWSSNQNNTTKSIPEGFYLADYLPRITKNQTLEFNRTLNCIDFKTLSNHRGMLFISGLYPTTDSCINFEIGLDQDGRAESYINTSNMLVMVWRNNDSYRLYSFWYSDKGLMKKRFLEIPAKDVMHNKIEFSIISDEDKRTNIIKYNDSLQLRTPYAYSSSRDIPYSALSHPMIQINNRIYPNSTYCTLHIYRIEQRIPRKIITPCGTKAKNAFGLDGPHKLESITNGINYMTDRGHVGTIWADVRYLNANNIPFIKNLLNNGWELGIHYSAELSKLPLKDAYSLMDSEYQIPHFALTV